MTQRIRPRRTEVRRNLLAAAQEVFLTDGYAASSVADIAARAGYTKGAVYSNFGGKPELFAEVCQAEFGATTTRLLSDLITDRSATLVPQQAAVRLAQLAIAQAPLQAAASEFRTLAQRHDNIATIYAGMRRDQLDLLTTELHRQHLLGPDRPISDYRPISVLLLGVMHSLSLEHRAAPEQFPEALLADALIHLIEGLLP